MTFETFPQRSWPVVLALSLLGIASCNAGNKTQSDAGSKDAAVIDSGTDADADGDNDADGDGDAGIDAGHDSGCGDCGCAGGGGVQACTSDHDCGGAVARCRCPKLLDDQEITSYCYPSCSKDPPCVPSDLTCVYQDADAGAGICLNTGYWAIAWEGKWVPSYYPGVNPPTTDVDDVFQIGSIKLTFSLSLIWEIENSDIGHAVGISYIAQYSDSQWQMQVIIPYDKFVLGTVDFSDCTEQAPCSGSLIEATIQGTTISHVFIRAINIIDPSGMYENWVQMSEVNRVTGQHCDGTLKLFFAEYSTEISVAK